MGKVPANFHGKKGRSGRKTVWEEHNKVKAINTLWEKLNNKIQANEELTEFEEKLVAPLLSKTIKTETAITGLLNINREVAEEADNAINDYLNDNTRDTKRKQSSEEESPV